MTLKTEHPHPSGRPLDHRNHDEDERCRDCSYCYGTTIAYSGIKCPSCFGTGCSRTREIEEEG